MRISQSNQFGAAQSATQQDPNNQMSQTSTARKSFAKNDFQTAPNQQQQSVEMSGPTSFASIYNKRNMHATVNDNFARVGRTASA